jgi:hypothetical protein
MSDVKAIRYLLANNSSLTAAVPADRIASDLPQGVALPAIEVSHISTSYRHTIASDGRDQCRSRVQVTVHASSRPSQKAIQALVRGALPRLRGLVNGVDVDSILKDAIGPDLRNDEITVFSGSQDFFITYTE